MCSFGILLLRLFVSFTAVFPINCDVVYVKMFLVDYLIVLFVGEV